MVFAPSMGDASSTRAESRKPATSAFALARPSAGLPKQVHPMILRMGAFCLKSATEAVNAFSTSPVTSHDLAHGGLLLEIGHRGRERVLHVAGHFDEVDGGGLARFGCQAGVHVSLGPAQVGGALIEVLGEGGVVGDGVLVPREDALDVLDDLPGAQRACDVRLCAGICGRNVRAALPVGHGFAGKGRSRQGDGGNRQRTACEQACDLLS